MKTASPSLLATRSALCNTKKCVLTHHTPFVRVRKTPNCVTFPARPLACPTMWASDFELAHAIAATELRDGHARHQTVKRLLEQADQSREAYRQSVFSIIPTMIFGIALALLIRQISVAWSLYTEAQKTRTVSPVHRPTRPRDAAPSSPPENEMHTPSPPEQTPTSSALGSNCSVCMDAPADVVLLPCCHICCCSECAERLRGVCPICREGIESMHVTFRA